MSSAPVVVRLRSHPFEVSHSRERAGLVPCLWLLLLVLPVALPSMVGCVEASTIAADKQKPSKFTRFIEYEVAGAGALQCNMVTFKNKKNQKVILASAVHVADGSYYQWLEKLFKTQDSVLYELIADPDAVRRMDPKKGGGSWVSTLQRAMKRGLQLEFQLEAIDYKAKNFVHADLDPETFAKLQAERGESIFTFLWGLMLKEMTRAQDPTQPDPGLQILAALFSKDRAGRLKYVLGKELERMIVHLDPEDGDESVIVTDRNKKAIAVLEDRLGEGDKKLCIFYGAAHMADMEERLWKLGFEKVDEEWVTAWDIPAPAGAASRPKAPKEKGSKDQESSESGSSPKGSKPKGS